MQVGFRQQIRQMPVPPMTHIPIPTTPNLVPPGVNLSQMPPNIGGTGEIGFDGKMLRKSVARKTVDHNPSVVKYLEDRIWKKDLRDDRSLQADPLYTQLLTLPQHMIDNPVSCVMTKFIRAALNKDPRPVFCVCWTPDGRRLITGASSGEFTLWNGLTFNFETILQAHNCSVRSMIWSHNEQWMLTGDDKGYVKYWQANMNNVKMFQGHLEAIRGLSFSPTDQKFTSCSDDRTVRIFDFVTCTEESVLQGHGSDVKCVDWHPHKAIIISGSKDSQQPIILWDAKSSKKITTIHAHKNTCTDLKWNQFNGNWLISSSRDHLCKLFDIRNLKEEVQSFRGHKKDACTVAWHPVYEKLFASGGADGSIFFWLCGVEKEIGNMEDAHDAMIWDLSWHPLGHMLVSGSNDRSTRFWTRNRPGDTFVDKTDEILTPKAERSTGIIFKNHELPEIEKQKDGTIILPGLGLEPEMIELLNEDYKEDSPNTSSTNLFSPSGKQTTTQLPNPYQNINQTSQIIQQQFKKENPLLGLDMDEEERRKKAPYAKPIPKEFEKAWKSNKPLNQSQPTQQQQQQQQPPISLMAQPLMSASPLLIPSNQNQNGTNKTNSGQPISLLDLMSAPIDPPPSISLQSAKRKLSQDMNDNLSDQDDRQWSQHKNKQSYQKSNYESGSYGNYNEEDEYYDESNEYNNQNHYYNNNNNRRNSGNRRGMNNSYNNDQDNSWQENDDSNPYNDDLSNRNRGNNNTNFSRRPNNHPINRLGGNGTMRNNRNNN